MLGTGNTRSPTSHPGDLVRWDAEPAQPAVAIGKTVLRITVRSTAYTAERKRMEKTYSRF